MTKFDSDSEIVTFIDSLSYDELNRYTKQYTPTDLSHYLRIQTRWLIDTEYYCGINLNKPPSDIDVLKEWSESHNAERFRAFYVLKFPEKVEENVDF